MLIDRTTRLLLVGVLLASGCTRTHFDPDTIGVDIEVASPESAASPTLYRASAKGDAARSGIEYFSAFGAAADRQCAGAPNRIITTIEDLDAPVRDGAALSMQFECVKVTLPNHVDLHTAQFDSKFAEPVVGLRRKQGWATTAGRKPSVREFNELIGGFVREAYADECGGGPMLIERVGTATELVNTALAQARKPRVHVNIDYRCVGTDASAATVAPARLATRIIENP